MRLAHPWYLLLVIPILFLVFLYLRGLIGKEATLRFSNLGLVEQAGVRHFPLRRILAALLRCAAFLAFIIALARPQTGHGLEEEKRFVVDVMMALDVSSSMATLDFNPENRLEAAKIEAKRFIESRPTDRMGLVIFARPGVTVCPLTTDRGALISLLEKVTLGILEDGTAIGVGLAMAVNRLKESEAKSKVVILLTDGINNSGEIDPPTAAQIARELGMRVYTIGMGKDGWALVPVNDPRFGRRLERVLTEIDEETMQRIAGITGGRYFRARDEKALREIFSEIDRLEKTEVKIEAFTRFEDHFRPFLIAGFVLVLSELFLSHGLFRRVP